MMHARISGVRGLALAAVVTSSLAITPTAFAGGHNRQTFNDASVSIRGGNGVAVSTCVNWAQDWTRLSPEQQKRHEKKRVAQANACDNAADAEGGSVDLTNVRVTVDQGGHRRASRNSATVTISGGDAVAVAACINVLRATASAEQTNDCSNAAIATGGSVTLKDTDITIIQG